MCYAGLDVGTTGVKAMCIDENGAVLSYAYRDYPLLTPRNGWCELDPDQLWSACCQALHEMAAKVRDPIRSLAVSSPAQAVVPLDQEGRPLYRFMTTVDSRTVKQDRWWRENKDEAELLRRTGLPFSSIYTVNKIMWLRENEPGLFSKVWKFLCVEDYITWQLTGETVIDYSLAGRGMLLNAREKRWDAEILELAGIRAEQLSTLASADTPVGRIRPALAGQLGLPPDLQVVVGAHDQTCGCIGSGLLRPGQAMNATGTVEVLETISPAFPDPHALMEYHYPCSPYVVGGGYLMMSINQSSGLLLKWYKDTFCQWEAHCATQQGMDPYRYLIESSSDQISDVYVLPYLNGAETPVQDPRAAGSIVHLRSCHTKADITRGVLDSLAYELRQNLDAFRATGCPISEIRAIGGGARTPKLLQIKADVCQCPILALEVPEAAALGAAIIGAVGIGGFASFEQAIAASVSINRVYEPDPQKKDAYNQHYREYKRLYPALREINQDIADRVDGTSNRKEESI